MLSKKVTSFNMYVDQASQIQAIMEATGIDKDARVLRELLDEALAGRRRKIAQQLTLPETPPAQAANTETLDTIQILLLKVIEQGEKARGVRGICLELLQEALAEARAGRELLMISNGDLESHRLNPQSASKIIGAGRQYAYDLAAEINERQEKRNLASSDARPNV